MGHDVLPIGAHLERQRLEDVEDGVDVLPDRTQLVGTVEVASDRVDAEGTDGKSDDGYHEEDVLGALQCSQDGQHDEEHRDDVDRRV